MTTSQQWVTLGHVSGLYGVLGWIRVYAHTEPRNGILRYREWWLSIPKLSDPKMYRLAGGRSHGKGIIASLEKVDNRSMARELLGALILVPRSALPPIEGGYYWADLIGLDVKNRNGIGFGKVESLIETGSHDVLVVRNGNREKLIPFAPGYYVDEVDLSSGQIWVDWHEDD